jgi:hypothetical protein
VLKNKLSSNRVRLTIALSVAVAALIAAAAPTVFAVQPDNSGAVLDALESVFSGSCLSKQEATNQISSRLSEAGYEGWTIDVSRVNAARCVSGGVDGSSQQVVLIPTDGPRVASALETLRQELMSRCLDEESASALVSNVVRSLGIQNFQVMSNGPFQYPNDEEDAVVSHVKAGCFVYSGTGHDANSNSLFFISGPDALS